MNGWLMKNYLLRGNWFAHSPQIRNELIVQLEQFTHPKPRPRVPAYTKTQRRNMSEQVLQEVRDRLEELGHRFDDDANDEPFEVVSAETLYRAAPTAREPIGLLVVILLRIPVRATATVPKGDLTVIFNWLTVQDMEDFASSLVTNPFQVGIEPDFLTSGPYKLSQEERPKTFFEPSGGWSVKEVLKEIFVTLASFIPGVNVWVSKEFGHDAKRTQELDRAKSAIAGAVKEVDEHMAELDRVRQGFHIQEEDITRTKQLASGAFGDVYAGFWGHIPVALKFLKSSMIELDPLALTEFLQEAQRM